MDVIDRFTELMVKNGIDHSSASRISDSLRMEYSGGLIYVPKKSEAEREKLATDIRNNVQIDKITQKYKISKWTVYRMMRKIRDHRA